MKKTYALNLEGKNPARLLDAAKHDIRKYAKRERAKPLPEGVDFWDFDCKLGATPADAAATHYAALIAGVDALVKGGSKQFYVELISKYGHRAVRPADATGTENPAEMTDGT